MTYWASWAPLNILKAIPLILIGMEWKLYVKHSTSKLSNMRKLNLVYTYIYIYIYIYINIYIYFFLGGGGWGLHVIGANIRTL